MTAAAIVSSVQINAGRIMRNRETCSAFVVEKFGSSSKFSYNAVITRVFSWLSVIATTKLAWSREGDVQVVWLCLPILRKRKTT